MVNGRAPRHSPRGARRAWRFSGPCTSSAVSGCSCSTLWIPSSVILPCVDCPLLSAADSVRRLHLWGFSRHSTSRCCIGWSFRRVFRGSARFVHAPPGVSPGTSGWRVTDPSHPSPSGILRVVRAHLDPRRFGVRVGRWTPSRASCRPSRFPSGMNAQRHQGTIH